MNVCSNFFWYTFYFWVSDVKGSIVKRIPLWRFWGGTAPRPRPTPLDPALLATPDAPASLDTPVAPPFGADMTITQ